MVGDRNRWDGRVAGVGAQDARAASAREIAPHTTRTDPPPKCIHNTSAQASDIARETRGVAARRSVVSEGSAQSTSQSACIGSSASEAARRWSGKSRAGKAEVGRDAARDVGREDGRAGDAERWLEAIAPEVLPPGVERTVNDSHSKWYRLRLGLSPLTVVLEIELWQRELWAHLAVTGRAAPPSLAELGYCRDLFLGDRKVIQVLPRKGESLGAALRTLHLYAQLESDSLPGAS